MEIIVLIAIALIIISFFMKQKVSTVKKREYEYMKKKSIMTNSEIDFYMRLKNLVGEKYYIVPQAHLSSLLSEKVKGQNWRGAFSRINGKSVDFLLCKVDSFEPFLAIELDDYTHEREDRIVRDRLVENIFSNSNVPLVRFKNGEWETEDMIFEKVKKAIESTN